MANKAHVGADKAYGARSAVLSPTGNGLSGLRNQDRSSNA
jgi:hypothetical protein